MKGANVWVRDIYGVVHRRRVWDTGDRVIYVTNDEQFERLETGAVALSPIGFPPEDVFFEEPTKRE